MNRTFLLQHIGLFLLLSAAIGLALSAYGQDDLGKILRASGRRLGVFVLGVAILGAAMAFLGNVVLGVG